MSKCKHEDVRVIEVAHEVLTWVFKSREIDASWRDAGDISEIIEVRCLQCHFEHRYNRYAKDTPAWVKALCERIKDHTYEEVEQ